MVYGVLQIILERNGDVNAPNIDAQRLWRRGSAALSAAKYASCRRKQDRHMVGNGRAPKFKAVCRA